MNRKWLTAGVVGVLVLGFAGYALYRAGVSAGHSQAVSGLGATQTPGDIDPQTGKRILYWQDPMMPGQRFDHPGKSPFMDMALVPVFEGGAAGGGVAISPRLQQNLGVRLADVTRGRIKSEITASATVVYDERDVALVQARANGFLERLRVRAAQDTVRQGEALADLYVPDWVAAQVEYLAVRDLRSPGAADLAEGARQRLRLAGVPVFSSFRIKSSGIPARRSRWRAPSARSAAPGLLRSLTARYSTCAATQSGTYKSARASP